jgi:SAM-dependent methyltransferase
VTDPRRATDPRTAIVGAGYDAMIDTWEAWKTRIEDDPRAEWCRELVTRLPAGARVVELGCGGGGAETHLLAQHFRLTGVDLSAEQLRRARQRVPEGEFVQADFTAIDLEPNSLDAVAAFYSFNHVPRDLLAGLFARIHGWLKPGGLFLTALGTSDTKGRTGDFLGAPSYFSSYPPETNSRLLAEAGFELLRDELVTIREPEGPVTFQWVFART